MTLERLTLDELRASAAVLDTTTETLANSRRDWPLAMQSAAAYRAYVADERELLKWIAAFSSAGLFLIVSGLRTAQAPQFVSSAIGPLLAAFAFLVSLAAAGAFWWRVDLLVGRHLEGIQHRVTLEAIELGTFLLRVSDLRRAVESGDVDRGNELHAELRLISEACVARGAPQPFIAGREAAALKWLCASAYATGIGLTVLDQLVRMVAG